MSLQSSPMSLSDAEYYTTSTSVGHPHETLVAYVDIVQDTQPWSELLHRASDLLGSRSLWEPAPESEFFQRVADLCPGWRIVKLAVNRNPKVHRFFGSVPHTHRAGALLGSDGSTELFSEDLSNVTQPKSRFKKPVAMGLFIAGVAPQHFAPDEL
eukprot:2000805-Amphidinium_carterae.1